MNELRLAVKLDWDGKAVEGGVSISREGFKKLGEVAVQAANEANRALSATAESAAQLADKVSASTQQLNNSASFRRFGEDAKAAAGEASQALAKTSEDAARLLDRYDAAGAHLRQLKADFAALDQAARAGNIGAKDDARLDLVYVNLRKEIAATEAAVKGLDRATAAYQTLGIRSSKAIADEARKVRDAYRSLAEQGLPVTEMERATAAMKARFAELRTEMDRTKAEARQVGSWSEGIASLRGEYVKLAASAAGVVALATSFAAYRSMLLEAAQASQKLTASLTYSSGSAAGAAQEIAYLAAICRTLGLDFATASTAYAKFAAATKDSGVSAQTTKLVFEGVAKAAANLGLSAEETNGVLLALSQMASKGTVSAEELRGQLGERLPGAFNLAARAMGVTTAELGKMLEKGEIAASDFLPRFGEALNKEFKAPLTSITSELNRSASALELFKRELATGTNGGGLKWLTSGINEATAAMKSLGTEAGLVNKLLVAIGGAMAGATGNGTFDIQKVQGDAMQRLSELRKTIAAEEAKTYLNPQELEYVRGLRREYAALERQLTDLAVKRGKEQGFKRPDLAGDYAAEQARQSDAIKKYLDDTKHAPKAVKIAKEIDEENKAFAAATMGLDRESAKYAQVLKSHEARIKEIKNKGVEGSSKNDGLQAIDAQISTLQKLSKARVDIIEDEIKEGKKATIEGYAEIREVLKEQADEEIALLTRKAAATKDAGDKEKVYADMRAVSIGLAKALADNDAKVAEVRRKAADAVGHYVDQEQKHAESIRAANVGLREQIETMGMTAQQLDAYKIQKLQTAAAADTLAAKELEEAAAHLDNQRILPEVAEQYRRLAAAKRDAASATTDQAALVQAAAGKRAALEEGEAWKRAAEGVSQSLTSAFEQAYQNGHFDGKKFIRALQDDFKKATFRIAIDGVVNMAMSGLSSLLGGVLGGDAGGSGSSGGGIGSLFRAAGLVKDGYNLFSGGGVSGLYSKFASSAMGQSLGLSYGAGVTNGIVPEAMGAYMTEMPVQGGLTSMGSSIGSALPVIGWIMAGMAADANLYDRGYRWNSKFAAADLSAEINTKLGRALGLDDKTTSVITGSSIQQFLFEKLFGAGMPKHNYGAAFTAGANGSTPLDLQSILGWSDGYGGQEELQSAIYTEAVRKAIASYAPNASYQVLLGGHINDRGKSENQTDATVRNAAGEVVYNYGPDVGKGNRDFSDFVASAIPKIQFALVTDAFRSANDDYKAIANAILGTSTDMTAAIKDMTAEAMATTQQAMAGMVAIFDRIKESINPQVTGAATAAIAQMAGGYQALAAQLDDYSANYFTDAERQAQLTEQLQKQFADLNETMPASKAAFRDLVRGLDTTTEAGQRQFAGLMAIEGAYARWAAAMQQTTDAAEQAGQQLIDGLYANLEKIAQKRSGLQDAIFQAMLGGLDSQGQIDLLKRREAELWAAVNGGDIDSAEPLKDTILQRIDLEAKLRAAAGKTAVDAAQSQLDAATKTLESMRLLRDQARGWHDEMLSLMSSDLSPLNYKDQLAAAEKLFNETLAKAQRGDDQARSNITNVGREYLQEAQAYYGANPDYANIFNAVTGAYAGLEATAPTDVMIAQQEEMITVYTRQTNTLSETITNTSAEQLTALQQIDAALSRQQDAVEAQLTQHGIAATAILERLAAIDARLAAMESRAAREQTA